MSLLLHIPHASEQFPPGAAEKFAAGENRIFREARVLGDLLTDQLFPSAHYPSVIFPWSRVFVDVERFRNNENEPMAIRGMGVIYEVGHDLQSLGRENPEEERERILREYYDPHHQLLEEKVTELLMSHNRALIIDCHSFPRDPLPYEDCSGKTRPEICIGTDSFHTPETLVERVASLFRQDGFSVALNYPFGGALVPSRYYRKDERVFSLMIEVRRDLFLAEDGLSKGNGFASVARSIRRVLSEISRFKTSW